MSMIMTLKQAPAATLDLLVDRPELAVVFWMDPNYLPPKQPALFSWIARLLGHREPELSLPTAPAELARNGETLNLDKSWHGVHWLLTRPQQRAEGDDWQIPPPEGFLLSVGRAIEGSDHGYGDERAASPREVTDFDQLLQRTPWETLAQRYDPQAMEAAGVYPNNWADDPTWHDDLQHFYGQLQDYVQQTADQSLGLVIQLS